MHVGETAARETVNEMFVVFNPALIEERAFISSADGFHGDVTCGTCVIFDRKAYFSAGLTLEKREIVLACLNGLAIDRNNYVTGHHIHILSVKRTAAKHFSHFQTVAFVGGIIESSERSC